MTDDSFRSRPGAWAALIILGLVFIGVVVVTGVSTFLVRRTDSYSVPVPSVVQGPAVRVESGPVPAPVRNGERRQGKLRPGSAFSLGQCVPTLLGRGDLELRYENPDRKTRLMLATRNGHIMDLGPVPLEQVQTHPGGSSSDTVNPVLGHTYLLRMGQASVKFRITKVEPLAPLPAERTGEAAAHTAPDYEPEVEIEFEYELQMQ